MRERIAQGILVFTLAVIVVLSVLFAARHNESARRPGETPAVNEAAAPPSSRQPPRADPGTIVRGRNVFGEQRCGSCHSIAGEGNPRAALDGVGGQLEPAELRHWILGSGPAAEILSPAVQRRKQRYASLPETDLAALVAYLSSLKQPLGEK